MIGLTVETAKGERIGRIPAPGRIPPGWKRKAFVSTIPPGERCLAVYDFQGYRTNVPAGTAVVVLNTLLKDLEGEKMSTGSKLFNFVAIAGTLYLGYRSYKLVKKFISGEANGTEEATGEAAQANAHG